MQRNKGLYIITEIGDAFTRVIRCGERETTRIEVSTIKEKDIEVSKY